MREGQSFGLARHRMKAPPMTAPSTPSTPKIAPKGAPDILADIWRHGLTTAAPRDDVSFTGAEPGLPSSFRLGAAGQAAIGAGLAGVGPKGAAGSRVRLGRGGGIGLHSGGLGSLEGLGDLGSLINHDRGPA